MARGRLLTEAILAIVVLRRGRWTVPEIADELGIHWRSAYRLLASLRAAGVTLEVSEERDGRATVRHYSVPGETLRRLLLMR